MPKVVDIVTDDGEDGVEAPAVGEVAEHQAEGGDVESEDADEDDEEQETATAADTSIDLGNRALLPNSSTTPFKSDANGTDASRLSGMSGRDFVKYVWCGKPRRADAHRPVQRF